MAIAKLQQVISLSRTSLGTMNITKGANKIRRETEQLVFTLTPVTDQMEILRYQLAQVGLQDLPSINREMRLILGQMPGVRGAMQTYFRLKRAQMAVQESIETGVILTPSLILTLIATMTLVVKAILKYYAMIERDKREYEKMVRQYRGWTKEEFKANMKIWEGGRSGSMIR